MYKFNIPERKSSWYGPIAHVRGLRQQKSAANYLAKDQASLPLLSSNYWSILLAVCSDRLRERMSIRRAENHYRLSIRHRAGLTQVSRFGSAHRPSSPTHIEPGRIASSLVPSISLYIIPNTTYWYTTRMSAKTLKGKNVKGSMPLGKQNKSGTVSKREFPQV